MKLTAILSDIHSNYEALVAVMEDAASQGADDFVCLGDVIGYGPSPRQVLRIVIENSRFCLMGNHEEGVLYQPVGFNWKAEASAYWTKDQLWSKRHPPAENRRFRQYLEGAPRYVEEGDVLYVHASPLEPTKEYVMPEASSNAAYMKQLFSRIKRVAFGGHTHLPGVFTPHQPFLAQDRIDGPFPLVGGKFFVNTGSVGQPRDGDTRACYVLFDGVYIVFRRVAYNCRKTAHKIKRIKRLPSALGTRLVLGL